MKKIVLFFVIFLVSVLKAQTTITKVLKDFKTLKVYNGIDVELIKSDKQEITISGEKAEKVKLREENDVLKISLRFPETMADGNVKVAVYFTKPILIIDGNEGSYIIGKDIDQPILDVKAQEGAYINLSTKTKDLTVKTTSGGVVKLTGSTENQTVKSDLASTYHGYNLEVENVSYVKAGSGAKAEVHSGNTLDAKVTFGGTILYKGQPEIIKEKRVIGGSIESRN